MDNFPQNLAKTQMFKEIKIEKVYMRVVKQIRELIKNGKLKPGDKLPPERILAERLGVSRPSVREGIVALEILGLVESRGGKGNIIKSLAGSSYPDQDLTHLEQGESPFEVLEARKIIEVEVAGYAAQRAQMEDIAAIDQILDSMSSIAPRISLSQGYEKGIEFWSEFHKFGREFHINVARAARNTVLLWIVTQLLESLKEDLWIKLKERSWSTPGRPQKHLREHRQILAAIQDKNSNIARKRMYQHLMSIQRDLFGKV